MLQAIVNAGGTFSRARGTPRQVLVLAERESRKSERGKSCWIGPDTLSGVPRLWVDTPGLVQLTAQESLQKGKSLAECGATGRCPL